MQLELHDGKVDNSLRAVISGIDFDYQAEQHVQDTHDDSRAARIVVWLLKDEDGDRCQWERPAGSTAMPEITRRSPRFQGEWQKGPNEVII